MASRQIELVTETYQLIPVNADEKMPREVPICPCLHISGDQLSTESHDLGLSKLESSKSASE